MSTHLMLSFQSHRDQESSCIDSKCLSIVRIKDSGQNSIQKIRTTPPFLPNVRFNPNENYNSPKYIITTYE